MNQEELQDLEKSIEQMMEIAQDFGLDFYPMRFEVCPPDIIYTFGAYGMPTRFHHWSFGKTFHRLKLEYDLGLSRIYELVINSNPCYAFLLDGNTLLQNKTVSAHVLAHCDFFKNNAIFAGTSRDMVERMASSGERIREYELEHGRLRVEKLLDAGMALQEHVDASRHGQYGRKVVEQQQSQYRYRKEPKRRRSPGPYDDLWKLGDKPSDKDAADNQPAAKSPLALQKDLMLFLIQNSPILEEWERDILSVLREEMLYFWPQIETKIMNEGWASFTHGVVSDSVESRVV